MVQIILGIVIIVLLILVIKNVFKGNKSPEAKIDRYNARTVKEEVIPTISKNHSVEKAILEYPAEKRTVIIRKSMFIIGRAQEADLVISGSAGISRKHAYIQYAGRKFYITDLNSTNHTFLNGFKLIPGEKCPLKNGDQIMIGKETLYFYIK